MGSEEFVEVREQERLARILRRTPTWSGYALADLEPPLWDHCRWFVAGPDDATLILRFGAWGTPSYMTFGEASWLARWGELGLEDTFHLHAPEEHVETLAPTLVGELPQYVRLGVDRETLRVPPAPEGARLATLSPEDAAAASRLYTHYPGTWYDPSRLADGGYVGVWIEGALVAAAGTHAGSERWGSVGLGDVVTDPEFRGRGLGGWVTASLAARWLARVPQVVLNVAVDNAPARRAYERVGFGRRPECVVLHREGHDLSPRR